MITKSDVREVVLELVTLQLSSQGRDTSMLSLDDDVDLLLSGLLDSLGMLELTAALEEYCGCELDFGEVDPQLMTVVGPLCEFVVAQAARQA